MENALQRSRKKSGKSYRHNFVKGEESQLFKILYISMLMEEDKLPPLIFISEDGGDTYTCKLLKHCKITIDEYDFKGYKGVLVRIHDTFKNEIITSKNMKVSFTAGKRILGAKVYEWEINNYIWNVRSKDKIFPFSYNWEYLRIECFECEFKSTLLSKRANFKFYIIAKDDGFSRIENLFFGTGYSDGRGLNKKNAFKCNFKAVFEEEYKNFWGECIDLSKTPYFDLF